MKYVKKLSAIMLTASLCLTAMPSFTACAKSVDPDEKNGDSYTRSLSVITDMVHDNPGDAPYVTQYDDVAFLAERGLSGKVFFLSEAAQIAVDFQDYDPNVFPVGSEGYNFVQEKKAEFHQKYQEAKDAGLKVYFMMDFVTLPSSMKDLYGDQIMTNGKIDINKQKTKEVLAELMREMFTEFPEVDGIYPRYGENYTVRYSGYHFGNNPIGVSSSKVNDHVTLLKFFREEVCVKYGKEVVYRTWSTEVGNDSFTTSPSLYLQITNQVEPHDNLYIAIKHTAGDFWRNFEFNQTIGIGNHQQIVEVQCAREYEGKGAYPNYAAGSVINGFKEYEMQMDASANKSLRDVVNCENSIIAGIWTWSRGGGWGGPYINGNEVPQGDELWCDLNAYVLGHWAQDTSRTDRSIVLQYAKEVLGMNDADAANFYTFCELSSDAVLYGIGTNSEPYTTDKWVAYWTRDAGIVDNYFKSNLSTMFRTKDGEKYVKLEERRHAVELWAQMVEIANGFSDSVAKKSYIQLTTNYGYYLFSLYERLWTAGILFSERQMYGLKNADEINAVISEFYELWDQYEALRQDPRCPSLNSKSGFTNIINGYICSDDPLAYSDNLAIGKFATASGYDQSFFPTLAIDGDATGDSRWAANEEDSEHWLCVDLGEPTEFDNIYIYWEAAYAKSYSIQISNDGESFTTIYSENGGDGGEDHLVFPKKTARYVRIVCKETGSKFLYSIYEFEVYNGIKGEAPVEEEGENLALNKTATASYTHNTFYPSNVTNGQKELVGGGNASERWNAGNIAEDCWICVDLGEAKQISKIITYWNYNNCPLGYDIQVSTDNASWTTVKTRSCGTVSSSNVNDYIFTDTFDAVSARYVRLFISQANREHNGTNWISLVEFEVYGPSEPGEAAAVSKTVAQRSQNGENISVRFIAAVDCEFTNGVCTQYDKVGFEVTVTDVGTGVEQSIERSDIYVYDSISGVTGADLKIESGKLFCLIINNTAQTAEFTVRAFAVTPEGEKVYGADCGFSIINGELTA